MSASQSPSASKSPSASQSPSASVSASPEIAGASGLFLYMRPDEMPTLNQPVTGGPTDTTGLQPHSPNWLTDGRPGRPTRGTSGSADWIITCALPGSVNFLVAVNTNLDAGLPISVTGDVTGSLLSSRRSDGIGHNPWELVTLTPNVGSLHVIIAGNTNTIVFGEFFAGLARTLRRGTQPGGNQQKEYRVVRPNMWSSVPGYDVEQDRWWKSYSVIVDHAEFRAIQEWEESTHRGLLPSIIVPDTRVNDAFAVKFLGFEYFKNGPEEYHVTLRFIEYPRKRW
jgi:hypothetical protein